MCGIAGQFEYSRGGGALPQRECFIRACHHMASRGPDGEGIVERFNGRVILGHRRLAILDPTPMGAQPMGYTNRGEEEPSDEKATIWITFNGEIYNFQELQSGLKAKGYHFRSNTDTETILALYQDCDTAMFSRLRGMYTFAIWDEKKRRVLLARDSLGIKPLYYYDDCKSLRFASQVKALLELVNERPSPCPAGQVGFLLWGHVPDPFTFFKGILAVPAGHYLTVVEGRQPELHQFLDLSEEIQRCEQGESTGSKNAKREDLAAVLRDSVAHHLVSDVPVGLFLSAGRDSATITAHAQENATVNLAALTLGFQEFKGTEFDETVLAQTVAAGYNAMHHVHWVDRHGFEREYRSIIDAMDQPTIDGVNTYLVSQAGGAHALKVALSGLGGDELFAGYPSFRKIPIMVAATRHLASEASGAALRRWIEAPLERLGYPKHAALLEYGRTYEGAYLLMRGLFMPWEITAMLDPEVFRMGWAQLDPLTHLQKVHAGIRSPRFKITALEMTHYMRNQLLRDSDWAGMAHSLEIRVPFVDIEVLRSVVRLVARGRPCDKDEMARTPRKPLPAPVLNRKKTGFVTPVRKWIADRHGTGGEASLRQWARIVYEEYSGESLLGRRSKNKDQARQRLPAGGKI